MKKIECYETKDGKLFTTYEEALMHEKEEEIKNDLGSILNTCIKNFELMEKRIRNKKLCENYEDAQVFKEFLVGYMSEIMLKDFTAFKSLFDGGLSCK
ncbi:hypothetical protein ACQRC6_06395 [Peptoniphilus sp. SGI.035]|uniref:hypothetical protein n=1 Tax=Peptoniphilus sp. SGI.035 TaxID=3420564 RepID=UPI003D08841B